MYVDCVLIRCLGPVALLHEGGGETQLSKALQHILALLVAAGPDGISTDRLADEIYGEEVPPKWEAAVRKNISRLRKTFEFSDIATRPGRYILTVPVDQVDLWTLLGIEDVDVASLSEDRVRAMLSGEPFGGVELSPLLLESGESINVARLQLVHKMNASDARRWSAMTLLEARSLVARSYYREDLLAAVLELHQRNGDPTSARDFATKARKFLVKDMGTGLSPNLEELVEAVIALPVERSHAEAAVEQMSGRVLGKLEPAANPTQIARTAHREEIRSLVPGPGVLITGDSGSGKSALVESLVADYAHSGHHVLWLTGHRGSTAAYQSFLSALPSLEQDLEPLLDDSGNERLRTRCWLAVRRRLAAELIDLPIVLVIDDLQWLDSHSLSLATFLAAPQLPESPTLVAIGRADPSAPNWEQVSKDLISMGLGTVEIGAFDHDELVELIGLCHEGTTSKQRHDFASALIARRAGLPAVAHEVVRAADPNTLAMADVRSAGAAAGIWVSRVQPEAQKVAAVAAVVGMRFRLEAIAKLSGLDIETIMAASDELCDSKIWVSEQRPDEFSFGHVLVHADFDVVLSAGDRRRLHMQSGQAALDRGDVHAGATHLVQAGALVSNDRVVSALLASAHEFHAQGSNREAVEAFSHAQRITDRELGIDDLLGFASAVSRSGGDGWDLQARAFERSVAAGDADQCLTAALHGGLRAERLMGNPQRVEMLERIDTDRLADSRRAQHAAALARELGLLGLHEQAIHTATAGMAAVSTADDRFTAWLGAWASCRALSPQKWPALPADRDHVTQPELVAQLAQVEFGQALITGDDQTARARLGDFVGHQSTQSDPLWAWHAALAQATIAFVDGQWDECRRLAGEAFAAASEHGIVAAFSTRLAQEFVLQWVAGDHGELLALFESAPPDIHDTLLAQAAFAVTLAEHSSQDQRAATMISEVATRAEEHRSPLSPSCAVLLASAPSHLLSAGTRRTLQDILGTFRGSAIVSGAMIAHLGPASWSLANLATDHSKRVELLRRAAAEAEAWNLRAWLVVCLRDLAAATGDEDLIAQARRHAAGSQLETLL